MFPRHVLEHIVRPLGAGPAATAIKNLAFSHENVTILFMDIIGGCLQPCWSLQTFQFRMSKHTTAGGMSPSRSFTLNIAGVRPLLGLLLRIVTLAAGGTYTATTSTCRLHQHVKRRPTGAGEPAIFVPATRFRRSPATRLLHSLGEGVFPAGNRPTA